MDTCVSISPVAQVKLRLGTFLDKRGLSAYKLAMETERGRENTVYRLARHSEDVKRIDLDVLADIIRGLNTITNEEVGVSDLLEYVSDTDD